MGGHSLIECASPSGADGTGAPTCLSRILRAPTWRRCAAVEEAPHGRQGGSRRCTRPRAANRPRLRPGADVVRKDGDDSSQRPEVCARARFGRAGPRPRRDDGGHDASHALRRRGDGMTVQTRTGLACRCDVDSRASRRRCAPETARRGPSPAAVRLTRGGPCAAAWSPGEEHVPSCERLHRSAGWPWTSSDGAVGTISGLRRGRPRRCRR